MMEEIKKEFEEKFTTLYENRVSNDSYRIISQDRNEVNKLWTWFEQKLKEVKADENKKALKKFNQLLNSINHIYNVKDLFIKHLENRIKELES